MIEVSRSSPLIITAPPGSGKTTLVPPALLDDIVADSSEPQQVLLLQPRRLAARAVARRIAYLRQSTLGSEIGYQVRFDNMTSEATRLIVMTTGVLLRRLIEDVLLENVSTVVLDEFHERSLEMDLALGMLWRIRSTVRPDLRIVVMSATLDASPVSALLGDCPVHHAEGVCYPVELRYQRHADRRPLVEQITSVLPSALSTTHGDILVFLPGVGEILRCRDAVTPICERSDCDVLTLYGDLPPEAQDRVLAPSERRKLILSTNVAETSLTIDGVTCVIDSGQARQMQVHPGTGLPRLEIVSISRASADQRAGRAGRTAPGVCYRLWDENSHRTRIAAEVPEVLRADLSGTILQLASCGEYDLDDFPWLDPPTLDAVANAMRLLEALGAIAPNHGDTSTEEPVRSEHKARLPRVGHITELGQQLAELPTHPRLGRLLLAGATHGVLREACIAAALLSERDPFRSGEHTSRGPRDRHTLTCDSDLVERVTLLQLFHSSGTLTDGHLVCHAGAARNVLRVADQLFHTCRFPREERAADVSAALMQTLLAAFPDRLTRLRANSPDRGLMVGGRGVKLDAESRVRGHELFLSIDLRDASGDARVSLASAVSREWLHDDLLRETEEVFFNPTRRQVEARRRTYWSDLLLDETPTSISDYQQAAAILAQQARLALERILPDADSSAGRFRARVNWLSRVLAQFESLAISDQSIAEHLPELCHKLRSLEELKNTDWLSFFQQRVGYERLAEIDRLAPESVELPGGKRVKLTYSSDKAPMLSVKIQEVFGLRTTPRVAGGTVPILLELLGPNYRPQQVTSDLESFWSNTYPVIRKELRRRYPKHAWPEDPFVA
jgi:ATP-dependent helicase HrpB